MVGYEIGDSRTFRRLPINRGVAAPAEVVAARAGIRLAVENHKDWRIDEMLGWLKRLSSNAGVCLDTGNSIALLEDLHEVVDAYALDVHHAPERYGGRGI